MIHLESQQELVRILQSQLQQEQERLKEMHDADTKISALTEELAPILEKYPAYQSEVAERLGFILPIIEPIIPISSTLRVIEIIDGDRKDEQKNVVSDTQNTKYAESSNCLDDNSLDNQTELPTTDKASKDVDVTWYNSISGEVNAGSEKRYFRVLWNNKQNQHQVGLKKSESAKRWSKDINPTTQPLIDAVWQEFKAGKPDDTEIILQKLCEAAEEVGGRFTADIDGNVGTLGIFTPTSKKEYFGEEDIEAIEVGYNDGSWWYIRPERNKVYCSGDVHAFAEILKGLKTDLLLESQKSQKPQLKTTAITPIETTEPNPTQDTSEIGNIITKFTSTFPDGWKQKTKTNLRGETVMWRKILTKTETEQIVHTNIFQGLIEINTGLYQWHFVKNSRILTLQEKDTKEPAHSNSSKVETAKPNPTQASTPPSKSSDCWYTPPEIVELVKKVLGKIDLDPCADHNKHIPAKAHYTICDDGLNLMWDDKVFMNPPYSCPGKWIEKLISEIEVGRVTEAIALVPASTDTKWFAPLWNQPICFWKGRIKFLDVNYQPKLPARQSHCLVYWGENIEKFRQVFSQFGEVKLPAKNKSTQVEVDPKEGEKTLTLTERITPSLLENWVIKTIDNDRVFIYSSDTQNSSNWVKVTDISHTEHGKTFPFLVSHETRFINDVKTIEEAIKRATWWFDCPIIDNLELLMDTINSYDTDLLKITREENSNTAHILSGEENLLGTIFLKSNDTLEIPEREYHLLEDLYSIDIGTLIEDIEKQKLGNYRDYLTGVSSLEQELNHLDTLQNALHCLSNHLNLIVIRQGEIFKAYNGKEWLENYLGSVKVNDSEIKPDEYLINNLLEQYSFLLNQLTIDIIKGEQSIEIESYIITDAILKELLIKETWNKQEEKTANNLLNKLVKSTPAWNELTETIHHQRHKLFENDADETDDNDTNDRGSIPPTPSPKNPNNNGSQTTESTKEELDTLFSAIQSYKTDLNIQKDHNKLTFYQQKYRLGSVEQLQNKLVAEEGLIANLKISYGIDIKGLIESIEFASLDNCFELDPFEHIGKSNPAIFIPGCVVAPTWEKGRGLQGVLQLVNGEIATIQWLNSLDHGDNAPEQVNIGLLRYIAAQQTAKDDSLHTETLSEEPTAESFAALKFGGLAAVTKTETEVVEDTIYDLLDDDDPTWMDAIKAEIEKLEGFKVTHDEVYLTAWHYGTEVGSIHHNEEDELEIEQKLIGELAKYNFDLEAFLVAENIPYQLYHLRPKVSGDRTQSSSSETGELEAKKPQTSSETGKKPDLPQLNDNINTTLYENTPDSSSVIDLLDQLTAVFDGFERIRTSRSGNVLWFYRGADNLYPCSMKTFDDNTSTLFPTVKLKEKITELYGIDINQVCSDLEIGFGVDINDYVNHSVFEQTIKDSQKNANDTITWQDIFNNAAYLDITDSQTSDELNTSTTTEQSQTNTEEHPTGLHWVKDTSMFNRSETYIVWNGTQECGKIRQYKGKKKNKDKNGKWYVRTNVCGPYFDTIEKAARACWQQITESSRAIELELIPK